MAFDREAALKTAEKALRLGRIDGAIAEYLRIVEAQPRDWNSANALGDLYVRANQVDQGIAQYKRIAEQLAREGFYPKAAALYKKILKIRPGDEPALLQAGDIAARQGLLADAKNAYRTVAERRRGRGDAAGAAEVAIRLGRLDPEDLEARLLGARAASQVGDTAAALEEFRDVARRMQALGNHIEALDVLAEVAVLAPTDVQVRVALAQGYALAGNLERARQFLDKQTAGDNPSLWLTFAEIELSSGRIDEGRAAVVKSLALDPTMRDAVQALGCRLAGQSVDAGYQCIDVVADFAVARQDFAIAAVALQEFVVRAPLHPVALIRLVETCVDGGLEASMYEAQALLADAYLDAGRALEARIISEDLVARDPAHELNLDRFRRALVMLGEADPDGIIAERLSGDSPFLATESLDLNEGVFFADADTSDPAGRDARSEGVVVAPRSLEQVFHEIRQEAGRMPDEEAAAEQYALAVTYHDLGMEDDAIAALREASRSPRQRFEAASMLARLLRERGETADAIEWFERAAEAPPTDPDAGRALLYDLAETLETAGEQSRALAVFVELEAESGGFRDVTERIDRLSTIQAKG